MVNFENIVAHCIMEVYNTLSNLYRSRMTELEYSVRKILHKIYLNPNDKNINTEEFYFLTTDQQAKIRCILMSYASKFL